MSSQALRMTGQSYGKKISGLAGAKKRSAVALVTSLVMASLISTIIVFVSTIFMEEGDHWRAVLLFLPFSLMSAGTLVTLVENRWMQTMRKSEAYRNRVNWRKKTKPCWAAPFVGAGIGIAVWLFLGLSIWGSCSLGMWVCYSLSPKNSSDYPVDAIDRSTNSADTVQLQSGCLGSRGLIITGIFHLVIIMAYAMDCFFLASATSIVFVVIVPSECKRHFRDSVTRFINSCCQTLRNDNAPFLFFSMK